MVDAATAPAPRERGWWRLLAALAAFLIVPALPLLATAVPVRQTLLLLVTALAACTLVGWWRGGRMWLAAVWCALAAWMLLLAPLPLTAHDRLARGWALLLAGAFGVTSLVNARRPFFVRALTAVALAGVAAGGILLSVPDGPTRVQRVVRDELTQRSAGEVARWRASRVEAERRGLTDGVPAADSLLDQTEENMRAVPRGAARVYPALLALQSLAALAVAWALFHRVSRTRIGPPLAPLREFRFSDQFVWGLIVGLLALILPSLRGLQGPGLNLLVFFGALYALRGLGVLAWFFTPSRSVTAVLVGVALLLLMRDGAAFALGLVGIGDTWLDWRNRARPTT
jgi:hypothetical protein